MAKKQYKRTDGRYARSVYIGRDDGGKRQYKTVYGATPQEVEKAVVDLRSKLHKGINIDAEHETFGEWADRWLRMKKSDVGPAQYVRYESYANWFKERLGDYPIVKIRSFDIQDIIDEIAEENPYSHSPSSKKTLRCYLAVVSQIFSYAVNYDALEKNPADAVIISKNAPKQTRRALTTEEQQWIIDTSHRAQRAAMIMMYSGLRLGELVPLTWGDVDLEGKTISVNKSVYSISGKYTVKQSAKSKAGLRVIDIPDRLVDFLTAEKNNDIRKSAPPKETISCLVCPAKSGKMMSPQGWKRLWESFMTDLNFKYGNRIDKSGKLATSKFNRNGIEKTIPPITAHWLRHTYATLLYLSGVDVLVAMHQLGHADIKTTLSIYTHLDSEHKRSNMDKLNDYLCPESAPCKSNASQQSQIIRI